MLLMDIPTGLHENIPSHVYHQRVLGVVNSGVLKMLTQQTPAHYLSWLKGEDQVDTKAMAFGRAFHCAVLEEDVFRQDYGLKPKVDGRTKEGKKILMDLSSSKELLDIYQWDTIHRMKDSLLCHPIAGPLFKGGTSEITSIYEGNFGLRCKARFDYWRPDLNLIVDIKTTDNASEQSFAKSITTFGYHIQAAHYTEAVDSKPTFAFIAIEKKPPYGIAVYLLDEEALDHGKELRYMAMEKLNRCLVTDTWPSYAEEVKTISLPGWAFSE